MKRFWMVWRANGRPPMVRHASEMAARQEAERLARANQGARFIVLEAVDSVVCPLPPVAWAEGVRDQQCNEELRDQDCDMAPLNSVGPPDLPF